MCEERGLPTGGDQFDKRSRLARSMRGELDELLPFLRKSDMVDYLTKDVFTDHGGVTGYFTYVGQAARSELETLLRLLWKGDPKAMQVRPLGRRSPIRFVREDDLDEEAEDLEDVEAVELRGEAEKVFRAGVVRDSSLMYYVKDGDLWAVPRKRPGQPKGKAVRVVNAGIAMDYSRYLYFLDGDGDIARKRHAADLDDERADEASHVPIAHGAIVAARYRGRVHEPARVIKVDPDSGDVLVHWYDDKFSEVAAEDIVRLSTRPWTLARLSEDEVALDEPEEESLDDTFLAWLGEHTQARPRASLLIKTLVNKLGRYTADQRLTTRAVRDLGRVLDAGGYVSDPDLLRVTQSPGIAARTTIVRRTSGDTSIPQDPRPPGPIKNKPPDSLPPVRPAVTAFERAALRLQFLVQNAAAIQRLDEGGRRRAVELAARELALGAADQIRLRALAHQYASTHVDLVQVVGQLRETLTTAQRRQLLDDLRELCPAGAYADDLVVVYATELGLDSAKESRLPEPPPQVMAPEPVPEPSLLAEPVIAGGVRANPLLDSLFDDEEN